MKIVVAMDSFKWTLKSCEACEIVAGAICQCLPGAEVVIRPMADGGEGTAEAMIRATGGRWVERVVTGPLPQMQAKAGFAWFQAERTALVEMAKASGLELLRGEKMNPLRTTTYGTGELIREAIEYGAERILLAVGGSATVDGGVGTATALGWRFLDRRGHSIALGGGGLEDIETIVQPGRLELGAVEVLCDVDNPLCGSQGAARIYGPQKGANTETVEQLERGLLHLAKVVRSQLGCEISEIPGGGAAGGLAAGAVAFMNGTIVSGIDTVMARSGLRAELASADWVVTGEGCFDEQSLRGKVVSGILKIARESQSKVAVLAGQVKVPSVEYERLGVAAAIGCRTEKMSLDYALEHSRELLCGAARRFAKEYASR